MSEIINSFDEVWNSVLDYCRLNITETAYNVWIKKIKLVNFDGANVVLRFPNAMYKEVVATHYIEIINEALENIIGFPVTVIYECEEDEVKNLENTTLDKHLQDYKNRQYTFENFIVGSSNRFAYAAAKAVAEDPGGMVSKKENLRSYNPLFIYGNSGLGKTHILNAISNEVKRSYPELNILYVKAEDFANEVIQAIHNKDTDELRRKYRENIDLFLIDDIQFIGGKTSTEEEFFHTFDTLVDNGKQIVITSDRPPKEIHTLSERMRSRFEDGLLADIQPPEYETRVAIIQRKADTLGFEISENVVNFIAGKVKSNIRQLEGITKKLFATCNLYKSTPTVSIVQSVMKDILEESQPVDVTIDNIIDEVTRMTGVTTQEIYGKMQKSNIAMARRMAFYIIRQVTNLSYEEIGKKFGKDHTTVMYNITKLEKEMASNTRTASIVKDIINNMKDAM